MSLYVKPNIDKVLYLFSAVAKKTVANTRCYEYRWDIPNITLNDWGKLSMVGQSYKSMAPIATTIATRILNISTKDNIDTCNNCGTILHTGSWNYLAPFVECPTVYLSPQSLNSITLSLNDDISTPNNGVVDASCEFVIIIRITEGDIPTVEYGNKIMNNNTQTTIPTY